MKKFNRHLKSLIEKPIHLHIAAFVYSIFSYFSIRGCRNNSLKLKGVFLKNSKIKIQGKYNFIKIASGNRMKYCYIYIKGDNCKIQIDERCKLNKLELWIEDNGGVINIGNSTTIEGGHIASTEGKRISIGIDCMFSHRVEIRNGDSHAIADVSSGKLLNPAKDVSIGNHVWLGADAKVLKGSVIGEGSIIATGAIVCGFVDRNTIYAGIPAKKVKENIFWKRER